MTLRCNLFKVFIYLFDREERLLDEVKIALVGKYIKLEDAYLSVLKALKHAALHCNRKLNIVVSLTCYKFCFTNKILRDN